MKLITLANMWKRIGAAFIDFLLIAGTSALVFMLAIFPNVLDATAYTENQNKVALFELESGLYQEYGGSYVEAPTDVGTFTTVSDLSSIDLTYETYTIKGVSLLGCLRSFYLGNASSYEAANLSESVFENSILEVGTPASNIASVVETDGVYSLTMIDSSEESTTVDFVTAAYATALGVVTSSTKIATPNDANDAAMVNALLYIIPTVLGASFLFMLLIPLLAPNGQTIGKFIFKLVVLEKDGYQLKRGWLVLRYLSYSILELLLGFASFGATFLISYSMFMFTKKRRCLHDYLCNSVVASGPDSLWFKDRGEEADFHEQNQK